MLYEFDEEGKPQRFSKTKIKEYRDKLKAVFPHSFDVDNPRSIRLELLPRFKKSLPRYRAKQTDAPIGRRDIGVKNLFAPAKEKVNESGIGVEYVFSKSSPKVRTGERWSPEGINLAKTKSLDPVFDLELLIFLYFFSCEMANGERAKKDAHMTNARFGFVMVEQVAANNIAKIRRNREMEDLVTNKNTFLAYEDLRKIASTRGIPTTGVEDEDRVHIYNVLQDETQWQGFKRVMEDVVGTRKNTADMSDINVKVTDAMKAKVLSLDKKTDIWMLTTTGGAHVLSITKATGTTPAEKKFNLIEYLKSDPGAMEKLNELLPESVLV